MAGKIRGITIQLDGDTSGLQKSLKETNKEIKNTQTQLKDVEKLLKLDPTNTELLRQKQELLGKAVGETESKLKNLKKAEDDMKTKGIDKNSDAFMALQREIAETEQNLKSLKTQADTTTSGIQKIKDVSDKVGTAASTLADKTRGLSTAAAGLVAGLGAMGLKSVQTADELATLSARTGISTDMLQKFAFASDMVDVSTEELATAFQKMKINMDQNPESFEALGVAVTDANGNLRDDETVYWELINALGQVEDETQRDVLAMELLGKSASDLNPLIEAGADTMKALSVQAHQAGYVLDEETLDAFGEFDDQLRKLDKGAEAAKNAKTVIWNGPMGVFENPTLAVGTLAVAKALAESEAITIIGGGDSAAAVEQMGLGDKMTHISTGGGASLEYLEGKTLPGVACLDEK